MSSFPDEDDLYWLLETDLEPLDPEYPMLDLRYTARRGADVVECRFLPKEPELVVRWYRDGDEIVALDLPAWMQIEVDRAKTGEALVVNEGVESLRLRLKPTIRIAWGTTWNS